MILHSFAELARIHGKDKNLAREPIIAIEHDLGTKAAVLWSLVQDREARGIYGDKGAIVVTPAQLVEESGYKNNEVASNLTKLILAHHLRLTTDGKAVKAA